MAKREINLRHFRMTEAGVELRADVKFSVKHDGYTYAKGEDGPSYSMTYDLTLSKAECAHKVLNTVIINHQNGRLRALSPAECKALVEGKVITTKDVYPGRGAVTVKRDLTPEEIALKAKNDPEYRKALMAQLAAMQDELDGNGD